MKFHAVSELFPRMSAEDFASLRDDISAHGVHEPAWLWRGEVIDGRHRVLACTEIGIECPTREWDGAESDLVPFVLSLNLRRRHLDASQRAMVAARISSLKTGQHSEQGVPIGTAAEMLNVGERSVKRARKVIEEGALSLTDAVDQGNASVAAAAEVAELPKRKQKRIVAQDRVQEVAAELREERKPKPEKPSELEALKAENAQLRSELAELASQQQSLQDDANLLEKLEQSSDKLAVACAEVKRLTALVRVLEERNRGFQNEKNEAVRAAKSWRRKCQVAQSAAA